MAYLGTSVALALNKPKVLTTCIYIYIYIYINTWSKLGLGEDEELSRPASVDLASLFKGLRVVEALVGLVLSLVLFIVIVILTLLMVGQPTIMLRVVEAGERGLTGTISREEVLRRRSPWRVEGEGEAAASRGAPAKDPELVVTLGPLQIRTAHRVASVLCTLEADLLCPWSTFALRA